MYDARVGTKLCDNAILKQFVLRDSRWPVVLKCKFVAVRPIVCCEDVIHRNHNFVHRYTLALLAILHEAMYENHLHLRIDLDALVILLFYVVPPKIHVLSQAHTLHHMANDP